MSRANAGRLALGGDPRGQIAAAALGGCRPTTGANPHAPRAAEHVGRSLPESVGANLMPIFDQGYQHWKGQLSGHGWRWLAIARHGVRIGLQGRVFRIVLLISLLPAIVL